MPVSCAFVLLEVPYVFLPLAWVFTATGIYFMGTWAMKKHRNYKKEFGKEYPRRKIMIPFIF